MRTAASKADDKDLSPTAACMQDRTPPALTMRVDQIVDRNTHTGLRERLDDEVSLPRAILVLTPVLDRAPTAGSEVRADWLDAIGARFQDCDNLGALALELGLDPLAGQGVRDKYRTERSVCDAVAAMPHAADDKMLDLAIRLFRFHVHEAGDIRPSATKPRPRPFIIPRQIAAGYAAVRRLSKMLPSASVSATGGRYRRAVSKGNRQTRSDACTKSPTVRPIHVP
jgi:hypothetical protein